MERLRQIALMAVATHKSQTVRKPVRKPRHSGSHGLSDIAQPRGAAFGVVKPAQFDVAAFCEQYSFKRDTISRMTSYTPRTVAAWATGTPLKGAAVQKVTELKRLTKALEQLVEPSSIGPWFMEPNASFNGSTPAQLVERGEADRIWRMIHLLESGQPG